MVTDCAEVYVPAVGEKIGAGVCDGIWMTYVAVTTALCVLPEATAIAETVVLAERGMAELNVGDEVVGVEPSSV